MIKFMDVIDRVRDSLSDDTEGKVLYKDIASALQLKQDYLAVIKRRGKIPYEALSYFADSREINLNWILLGKEPRYLTKDM